MKWGLTLKIFFFEELLYYLGICIGILIGFGLISFIELRWVFSWEVVRISLAGAVIIDLLHWIWIGKKWK